jgi:HlyD family secretion protein
MGRRQKKWIRYTFWSVLLLLLIGVAGVVLSVRSDNQKGPSVPSAEVKLGDFVDYVEIRGEIAVRSSKVIAAPYNTGDLQILKLARNGTEVQAGDVVVEFDPSTLKRTADQARASLKQVEAEIARAKAQQRLSEEQIKTEMMSAEFALQRARLDAGTGDVIPAIEKEKYVLALDKAEQKLRELESRLESRRVGLEADLAVIDRRRAKAQADLDQAEGYMAALTLTSPSGGIITLLPNSRARTMITGSAPPFKEGDRAYAGAAIAEIPDMSTLQANAMVTEADRWRVQPGQPVILSIEGVPDKEHKGRVREISPLAKTDYSDILNASKNFEMAVELEKPDPRLQPGMTAGFRVEAERVHNAIVIPAEAVFSKHGQTVAYVLADGVYQERPLILARRSTGQVMVSRGLKPGEQIALKDPMPAEQK